MRVLIDANALISYMLNPDSDHPPSAIVNAGLRRTFELLISETTLTELTHSVSSNKPYLRARIRADETERVSQLLRVVTTVVPEIGFEAPQVARDYKDDYLLAHAVLEQVDFLVSGDRDLLALQISSPFRTVSPADFVLLLDTLDR